MVKKKIIEKPEDVFMLTFDEIVSKLNLPESDHKSIKILVEQRKKETKWYKSIPGFSQLIFSGKAVNAPIGKVGFICTVTDESHIRGSAISEGKVKYPAVICKCNLLPNICDPQKIYVLKEFTDIPENVNIGGLIIAARPSISQMDPDLFNFTFPVICAAEHADSIICDGDIVCMDCSSGDINISHKS